MQSIVRCQETIPTAKPIATATRDKTGRSLQQIVGLTVATATFEKFPFSQLGITNDNHCDEGPTVKYDFRVSRLQVGVIRYRSDTEVAQSLRPGIVPCRLYLNEMHPRRWMNFSHSLNNLPFETVLPCIKTIALERAVKATEAAVLTI